MYQDVSMAQHAEYNFVMGVQSGMPADPELLPLLARYKKPDCPWQVTAIGRAEIWPLHRRAAELGGHLRTGVEGNGVVAHAFDCIYGEPTEVDTAVADGKELVPFEEVVKVGMNIHAQIDELVDETHPGDGTGQMQLK